MGIKTVEDGIIERVREVLMVPGQEKLRQVDSLPGDWDADMLKRLLRLMPGVFVAFAGGAAVAGNTAKFKAQFAVLALTSHANGEAARRRGDNQQIGAYEILEVMVPKLHGLKIEGEGTLTVAGIENLYNGELDKQGVAAYAARFEILLSMPASLDLSALDAFTTFSAEYDLAPMERFLLLTGDAGAYASTPDALENRIPGDIEICIVGSMNDYTPAAEQALISKVSAAPGVTDAYRLALLPAGILRFGYSTTGANLINRDATAALPFVNHSTHAWRCKVDADNGAGGHTVRFERSDDYDPDTLAGTWTAVGDPVTNPGVLAMFAGSAPLAIGADADGTLPAAAKLKRVQIFAAGVLVVDHNPNDAEPGAASFESENTDEVWTMNGTAKIEHTVEASDTVTLPQS